VFYTLTPSLPVSLWTVHQVSDDSLLTTVSNLLIDRSYSLRLLAFTDVGDGPLSHVITVNTSITGNHSNTHMLPQQQNEIYRHLAQRNIFVYINTVIIILILFHLYSFKTS